MNKAFNNEQCEHLQLPRSSESHESFLCIKQISETPLLGVYAEYIYILIKS